MRFPSISDHRNSYLGGGAEKEKEKESSHVDRIEDAAAGQDVANTEARDEAWRARERRIVRKLDVTLLPTVWTLYLFKFVSD